MKKLIVLGILSTIVTLIGILAMENMFEEKSIETKVLIKKPLNLQEENERGEHDENETNNIDKYEQR